MTKEEMQNSYIEMLIQDLEKHSFDYWESTQDEMVGALRNLQQENKQIQERMEYLERSNNRREDIIIEQRQEISDLEDNWNKLKEYIKTEIPEDVFIYTEWFVSILDKMQELEQGSDE